MRFIRPGGYAGTMRWLPFALVALVLAGSLPPPAGALTSQIQIQGNAFAPESGGVVRIVAGDSVIWTNADNVDHTATMISGPGTPFNTGLISAGQTSQAIRLDAPGTYVYQCSIHSSMKGSILVDAPPDANQPPVAAFNVTKSGLFIEVDAASSFDPDGAVAAYAWDWGDGSRGAGRVANHTYAAPGTYHVRLTVTDDDEDFASKEIDVTVTRASGDLPPVANFTIRVSGLNIDVDGRSSIDPERGEVARYVWDWGDGTPGKGTAVASHTYLAAGTYVVTLTVHDVEGQRGSMSVVVNATRPLPANQPPRAIFTATVDDLLLDVDASPSFDGDGHVARFEWDWGDGTTGEGDVTQHLFDARGNYTVTLTVTDDRGAMNSTRRLVRMGPPPAAPVGQLALGVNGLTVTADASASLDPDDAIASYAYDFGDGGRLFCDATGECESLGAGDSSVVEGAAIVQHRYLRQGTFTVLLRLTDVLGLTSETQRAVTVSAQPAAAFRVNVTGRDATFDARDVPVYPGAVYAWTMDGSPIGAGAVLHYRFARAGAYQIGLNVQDAGGALDLVQPVVARDVATTPTTTNESPTLAWGALAAFALVAFALRRR